MQVTVLDDQEQVAASLGPWHTLPPGVRVHFVHRSIHGIDALVQALQDTRIVCLMRERTPLPAEVLQRLPGLRLVVTTGMRNDTIDLEAARSLGITVCGTPSPIEGTAELTWSLVLAVARKLPAADASVRAGFWHHELGTTLHGRRLGLLGLGRIGALVAGYGRAFGMEVIAWSQHLTEDGARHHGVRRVDRKALFRASDVLSVHLRLSERTRGLVGADELALLPRGALVINTARSEIIDVPALAAALDNGHLGGAGIDVFTTEPAGTEDPLVHAPNTVLTPHIGYVNDATYRTYHRATVEAIAAWLAGQPIRLLT